MQRILPPTFCALEAIDRNDVSDGVTCDHVILNKKIERADPLPLTTITASVIPNAPDDRLSLFSTQLLHCQQQHQKQEDTTFCVFENLVGHKLRCADCCLVGIAEKRLQAHFLGKGERVWICHTRLLAALLPCIWVACLPLSLSEISAIFATNHAFGAQE